MSSAKQSLFRKCSHNIQVSIAVVSVTSQPEGKFWALPLAETNSQNKPRKRAGKTNHTNKWKSFPHETNLEKNQYPCGPKTLLEMNVLQDFYLKRSTSSPWVQGMKCAMFKLRVSGANILLVLTLFLLVLGLQNCIGFLSGCPNLIIIIFLSQAVQFFSMGYAIDHRNFTGTHRWCCSRDICIHCLSLEFFLFWIFCSAI